jgi:hypothetical protein
MTHPNGSKHLGQANVTGDLIQRAAAIISLADQISKTEATDEDIIDVLKRLKASTDTIAVAAVRAILLKGK